MKRREGNGIEILGFVVTKRRLNTMCKGVPQKTET